MKRWQRYVFFGMLLIGAAGAALRSPLYRVAVKLFGPPRVSMSEQYRPVPGSPQIDHGGFDAILKAAVEGDRVDYTQIDSAKLTQYLERVASAPFETLSRDEKLALLINGYNAFTLKLIADHYPVESIRDIPKEQRWEGRTFNIGGRALTLGQLEHQELRAKFREPRIHFAITCASVGCAPLRAEAYRAETLEAQLEDQTRRVMTDDRWVRLALNQGRVELTPLFSWYENDFVQIYGSPLAFVARYHPELAERLQGGKPPEVSWLDYDWALNETKSGVATN